MSSTIDDAVLGVDLVGNRRHEHGGWQTGKYLICQDHVHRILWASLCKMRGFRFECKQLSV